MIPVAAGKTAGQAGIFVVNLFLGWTVVGWLLACAWAFTGRTTADVRPEEQRHQEMLAMITAKKE